MNLLARFFKRRALACAIEGDKALFIRASYRADRHGPGNSEVVVDFARAGRIDDNLRSDLLSDIPGRFRFRPVWVPVFVENIAQQNDIRVIGIDLGGNGEDDLRATVDSQLQDVEADDNVEYAHTVGRYGGAEDESVWIGGSLPKAIMKRTFDWWRKKRHFHHPRIGSRHVALVNIFLALHGATRTKPGQYTLLARWGAATDFFCLLKGATLVACGNSSVNSADDFAEHMEHLAAWAHDFMEPRADEGTDLGVCVVSREKIVPPDNYEVDTNRVEFWEVPWDRISCPSPDVEKTIRENKDLAMTAVGLALHGV